MVLEEFLYTALLHQATNTRNIHVLAVLKQYLVFVKKEQWGDYDGDFSVQLVSCSHYFSFILGREQYKRKNSGLAMRDYCTVGFCDRVIRLSSKVIFND